MNDNLYEVAERLIAFDTVSTNTDRDAMGCIAGELTPLPVPPFRRER